MTILMQSAGKRDSCEPDGLKDMVLGLTPLLRAGALACAMFGNVT